MAWTISERSSSAHETNSELVVPDTVQNTPGPIRWILERTYCPLLSADDTPRERLLKTFVFITLPLQFAPLAVTGMSIGTILMTAEGATVARIVEIAMMTLIQAVWAAAYGYVRVCRRVRLRACVPQRVRGRCRSG